MKKPKNIKDETHYDEDFERSFWEDVLDFFKTFLLLSLIIVVLANFIIKPAVISGSSMLPNLHNGQKGFSNIISLVFGGLDRGDVVVAKVSLEEGKTAEVVKRVIALPCETISCHDNVVYINDQPLDESAWLDTSYARNFIFTYGYFTEDFDAVTLKEHEYFLMGDNRPVSRDSRDFGPFSDDDILAKGFFTLYPIKEFGYYGG